MKHTTSRVLFDYWNEVRSGRPAPRRFEIEPSRISTILAQTIILERVDFETYRFRLAGTRVCEYFGRELRGEDLFTLWDSEDDRQTLEHHLSLITRQFKVGRFTLRATTGDQQTVAFEMLLLPLVHTRGIVDRCLGSVSLLGSLPHDRDMQLSDFRLVATELLAPDQPNPQDSDNVATFTHDVRMARIVRSDRRQFRVYEGGLGKIGNDSEPNA